MHIRSYARAFPTDRRIYRIDRWAIPLPGGLPLAASAWFMALGLLVTVIGQLPGASHAVSVVGWPAAVLVAPGAGALVLTRRCSDGRTLPRLARHRAGFERAHRCKRSLAAPRLPRALMTAADVTLPGRVLIHGPGRIRLHATSQLQLMRRGVLQVAAGDTARRAGDVVIQLAAGEQVGARS